MGGGKAFRGEGRQFRSYLYQSMSRQVTIGGVTGRLIAKKDKNPFDPHHDLPSYSEHSDVYFYSNSDMKTARQAKVYKNKEMVMDFDWDHGHTNRDGTQFFEGTVHVQTYTKKQVLNKKTGKKETRFIRSRDARRMTAAEIKQYGPILKHFYSDIKF